VISARWAQATSRARGPTSSYRAQPGLVEGLQQPPARRVRRHVAEQAGLVDQDRDVVDRLRAISDGHREIGQDPAGVVAGSWPTQPGQHLRQLAGQRRGIGQVGEQA